MLLYKCTNFSPTSRNCEGPQKPRSHGAEASPARKTLKRKSWQSGWLPTSFELKACEVAEGGGWKAEPLGLPQQGAHDWSKRSQGTIETRGRRQYTGTHA